MSPGVPPPGGRRQRASEVRGARSPQVSSNLAYSRSLSPPDLVQSPLRRYVGAVGRRKEALDEDFSAVEAWPQQVAPLLPPLPLPAPSQVYMQHLMADPEVRISELLCSFISQLFIS